MKFGKTWTEKHRDAVRRRERNRLGHIRFALLPVMDCYSGRWMWLERYRLRYEAFGDIWIREALDP